MSDEQYSLTDQEIQSSFVTYEKEFRDAMLEATELLDRLNYAQDTDEVSVSAGSLRKVSRALLASHKPMTKTEAPGLQSRWPFEGDRGKGCDYNPFNKVNW